jgi:hypothetical protein
MDSSIELFKPQVQSVEVKRVSSPGMVEPLRHSKIIAVYSIRPYSSLRSAYSQREHLNCVGSTLDEIA